MEVTDQQPGQQGEGQQGEGPPQQVQAPWMPPSYTFVGANMGGEGVFECGQCGSLVRDSGHFLHSHWHQRLQVTL